MTRLTFLTLAALLGRTNGFLPSSKARVNIVRSNELKTNIDVGTDLGVFSRAEDLAKGKNMPIGEAQRPFRRTVYTHDDWKKHRSQDRFFYYLLAIFKSGVYKNLAGEVFTVSFIATFVVLFNALAGGYTDLAGVEHAGLLSFDKIGIPMNVFTLTSPSLGLLLGRLILLSFSF